MKNKLIDVHNILMATLEDLDDEELYKEEAKVKTMLSRTKLKCEVAKQIVEINRLQFDAIKYADESPRFNRLPETLELEKKENAKGNKN